MRSRAALGALGGLAVLVLGLSGCSGSTPAPRLDSGSASDPGGPAGSTGGPAPMVGARVDGTVMAGRVRAAMAVAGSARFALQSSTTSGQDASGALNVAGSTIKVSLDFNADGDQVRVISLPGVLYADVGQVVDGKHWLKVVADATDPVSSAMQPLLSYMTNSADISSQAASWGAAGEFSVAGRATIAGEPVTEYDVTVPLAAVQANLPAQFREVMRKDVTGDSRLRLWLDAAGRPVRLVTAGSYDGKPDLVTVTYTDWGAAPDVVPPDPADVIAP